MCGGSRRMGAVGRLAASSSIEARKARRKPAVWRTGILARWRQTPSQPLIQPVDRGLIGRKNETARRAFFVLTKKCDWFPLEFGSHVWRTATTGGSGCRGRHVNRRPVSRPIAFRASAWTHRRALALPEDATPPPVAFARPFTRASSCSPRSPPPRRARRRCPARAPPRLAGRPPSPSPRAAA